MMTFSNNRLNGGFRCAPLLALMLVSAACIETTDFKDSDATSDNMASSSSTSEGSTTDDSSGSSTTDDSTGDGSSGSGGSTTTGGEAFPACDAYSQGEGDAEACAEELDCTSLDSEEACFERYNDFDESDVIVGCRWGSLFTGSYDEVTAVCTGEITKVCLAAEFIGEGGPDCVGFHRQVESGVEVVELGCGVPLAGEFENCADGFEPEDPVCSCLNG